MTAQTSAIVVEGEMTIYRAAELREALFAPLAQPAAGTFEVDLAGVTEIDTSGIQLLLALKRRALALGRELRLLQPSAAVTEALGVLGLAGAFRSALAEGAAA